MPFDGETYDRGEDKPRLMTQLEAVRRLLDAHPGRWWSLPEIRSAIGFGSEASISARLRDFRKLKFGGIEVERRNDSDGLWRYRFAPPKTPHQFSLLEEQ
jgi:hypothetical protein